MNKPLVYRGVLIEECDAGAVPTMRGAKAVKLYRCTVGGAIFAAASAEALHHGIDAALRCGSNQAGAGIPGPERQADSRQE